MNDVQFYDKVYKAKCWINITTSKMADQIVEAFVKQGAFNLVWPTDNVDKTIKKMANEGWFAVINGKDFPRWVTEEFCEALLRKHMTSLVGANVFSMPTQPYSQALNRKIEKPKDFVRVFEDCLGLEDPLTLSRMFDLATPRSLLYITRGGNTEAIAKVSDVVLTVGDKTAMISVGKKPLDQIVEEIEAALPKSLKGSGT